MKPQLTPEEREARQAWLRRTMAQIPPDHDWARAVVMLVESLAEESMPSLLAPPTVATHDDRTYNAGRVAFAEDLLHRVGLWHRAAVAHQEQSVSVPESP